MNNEYEAMYLLENNAATADFEGTAGQVDQILTKHGASIVQKEKWDERKLAYEIKGQRRATYYLVYYSCDPQAQKAINEDLGLNEVVLRHLTLRLEEPIAEHIEKRAVEREALAEDSRRNSLTGWGDRRKEKPRRGERPRDGSGAEVPSPGEAAKSPDEGAAASATATEPAPPSSEASK
jgi:small subunit ribosomal protein S6